MSLIKQKMNLFKDKYLSYLVLSITPVFIVLLWIFNIFNHKSIFPTDTFTAYLGWYQPGNASQVTNHYSLDINFAYFPWKYYLAKSELAHYCFSADYHSYGITTPNQECYPLWAVRHYTFIDPRRILEKVFPFFLGYDIGYLILSLTNWLSCLLFLRSCRFPLFGCSIGSTLLLATFWISKELQYDQYSAPLFLVYLALSSILFLKNNTLKYACFSILTFLSLLFSSLQGFINYGILILISLFLLKILNISNFKWKPLLVSLAISYVCILVTNWTSFASSNLKCIIV